MIEIIDEYFTEVYSDGNYNEKFYQEIEQSYLTLQKVDCRRLLIIGKVQSGKTSHFIGLTCKLFDNNYQLGIVFSGTKNNLHNQTIKRFQKDLAKTNIHIVSDNDKNLSTIISECKDNRVPLIIICLKNYIRIDKLRTLLASKPAVHNTFIIDDESDQASLNSNNLKNIFSDNPQLSSTHKSINKLEYLLNPKYIQITATPAAHLLTDDLDYFKPDYVYFLRPHENYFGNELLFKDQKYLITIINEDPKIPNINNLARFTAQYLRNVLDIETKFNKDNISCFIHPHSEIKVINNYGKVFNRLMNEFKLNLLGTIEKYHLESFKLENSQEKILKILNIFSIQIVAGDQDNDINFEDFFKENKYFCLIGGGKLERGFTIEGLVTSFIPRASKVGNGDTIQQRARFFGSKKDLLPNIHVFMNNKTYNDFEEYYNNERYIFNNNENSIKTSDLKLKFLEDFTNPCRPNVLRSVKQAVGNTWQHFFLHVAEDFNIIRFFDNKAEIIEHTIPNSHNQHIMRIDSHIFIDYLRKLEAVEYRELSTSFDRIQYLLNFNEDDTTDVVLLGNSIDKFRERSSIIRNGQHLPSAVHQSYSNSSNYIGDANILLNYQNITCQFSLIHLKLTPIYYLTISFKINHL